MMQMRPLWTICVNIELCLYPHCALEWGLRTMILDPPTKGHSSYISNIDLSGCLVYHGTSPHSHHHKLGTEQLKANIYGTGLHFWAQNIARPPLPLT